MQCDERGDDRADERPVLGKAATGHVAEAGVHPTGRMPVGGDGDEVGDVGGDEHTLLRRGT